MLKEIIPGWCLGEIIVLGITVVGLIGVIIAQIVLIVRDKKGAK